MALLRSAAWIPHMPSARRTPARCRCEACAETLNDEFRELYTDLGGGD